VHTETIDTGERREMFGYTARRVIIRTTHRITPEDDARSSEAEAEGWYIDPPAAWLALHPPTSGHAIFQAADDTPVFTDIGPREKGFSLLVRKTERSTLRDAEGNIRAHMSEDRDEVTEFSEEALDPDLFVPPRDFRRVARLPGEPTLPFALRMRIGWQNFKHKFMAR
jgi:diadenosine tetraphosphate (Ap4A) HIT family hydrolase